MATPDYDALRTDALARIEGAADLAALAEIRVETVGRSAPIPLALRDVGSLPAEERGQAGKRLNEIRQELEAAIEAKKRVLEDAALEEQLAHDRMDVTLPGRPLPHGGLHVLTQTRREIEDIFLALGYSIAEGPEIESEYNNFTALNIPDDHPAKADSDTLWISDGVLLRTHTSPVQVRVMNSQKPPIAVICPGRVYRRDTQDATHSPIFHQVEGLVVDEGISLAHLKGTLELVAKRLFGEDRRVRLRPGFFPFTEPSVEMDVSWGDGWMEVLGAGMVDPNVFELAGIDPERYTGFAFGMGIERIAMLRHGIPDIRMFYDNDVRFLSQFPG